MADTRPGDGISWPLMAGVLLFIVAVVTAIYGFLALIRVLEGGGYGTPGMRNALVTLGTAGALLAGGTATIIWEIAKRYENPGASSRQPQVGKPDDARRPR
jgi:hypothetical protein